jgi:hypothetical protein
MWLLAISRVKDEKTKLKILNVFTQSRHYFL